MKAKIIPISIIFFSVFIFSSCEDSTYREYTGNSPVYMSYEDLRKPVSLEDNITLRNPGKIYFKDNFIFIVEEQEGIHVFDNTVPSTPVKKTFISIPGVVDIAVSGFYLYADSYVDLVVLDISDMDDISTVGRVKDVLPYTVPATGNDLPDLFHRWQKAQRCCKMGDCCLFYAVVFLRQFHRTFRGKVICCLPELQPLPYPRNNIRPRGIFRIRYPVVSFHGCPVKYRVHSQYFLYCTMPDLISQCFCTAFAYQSGQSGWCARAL